MPLRLFADRCISNFMVETLQGMGHEVLRLRDCIPTDSSDLVVISKAQELKAILVSLNRDFADIVTYPPANYKGIIAPQVRNHPEIVPQIMGRLEGYLSAHKEMNHHRGKLLLAEAHRIRVRE